MSGGLVMGVDLGTTGAKAVVVEIGTGMVVSRGYRAYPSASPLEGAHEQNPTDWWSAATAAIRQCLMEADPAAVRAVGLSGHMHALVLADVNDTWLRPAMTWADRRCTAQVQRLRRHQVFSQRCGNPVVEAFTAPKLAWVAENEPRCLEQAVRLVQPKDALRHELTGTWGTDLTDARGTLLFDVRRNKWDEELWRLCGADVALAPDVAGSSEVVGTVTQSAAGRTGLPPGVPVVAGASDVACSAMGAGLVSPGTLYVNAGTAAQILGAVDEVVDAAVFTFGRAASEGYLAMASVYAAGMSVDWAANTLLGRRFQTGSGSRGAMVEELARQSRPGADGVVFVPHLLGTSVPAHDASARGALVGLAAEHTSAAVARAILEGVAYSCAAAVKQIGEASGGTSRVRVGGGLARSEIWCEAMAAVHDVPLERVPDDASPLGAAMLAGMGLGAWQDVGEATDLCVRHLPLSSPAPEALGLYRRGYERYEAVSAALATLSRDPSNAGDVAEGAEPGD
ncbi:xylulokinase [Terrabacter terrigena]|uniref:Xylulokinase n=1 Tax=Terrabacter terrigena TaxID=574718 RepID=A0ABW3N1G1_9MICO